MSQNKYYNEAENDFFVKNRVIFLCGEITAQTAYEVGFKIQYLDYLDDKKPITLQINSPGGEVTAGLAIIDTIRHAKCPVRTVVCGLAASMAAVIAACGTKGMRYVTPNSEEMIHQPLGGMPMSQATDFEIHNRHIQLTKQRLIAILARACGRTVEEIGRDTERDCYLNAEEAVAYGLVDEIIASRKEDMA